MVDSEFAVGIKSGNSGVMFGYQVDEFTCTWSTEGFFGQSHIYPGFTGKVSTLSYFPPEPVWEDYSFLDQAVEDFKQSWFYPHRLYWYTKTGCILWWGWCHAFFSLFMVSMSISTTALIDCSFLLRSNVVSYGGRLGHSFYLYYRQIKCQSLCWFITFSSHPAVFGFQASLPLDNITLNPANKRINQRLSDFQTRFVQLLIPL